MSEIELIIFDCDGVLIDSETLSQKVLLSLLKQQGVSVDKNYFNAYFLGRTFESVAQKVKDDFSVVLDERFRSNYRDSLFEAFDKELQATKGIEEILKLLNVKSCVATSSSPARVKHALNITGLDTFFSDRVFTASLVKRGKPAPDIFLYAAEQMNTLPEKCLVIEDSASGVKAGVAANMNVIQFNGATHMQHYGKTPLQEKVDVICSWSELQQRYANLFHKR